MVAYYDRELKPLGLTAHQAMALGVLWTHNGLSLGDFARAAGIGKAAAVTMVDRLESLDLVRRREHPSDARLNRIEVTEEALRLAPMVLEKVERLEQKLEVAMGREGLANLIRGLATIQDVDF
jgi:DNA-binding MarR family transcriptional regulator